MIRLLRVGLTVGDGVGLDHESLHLVSPSGLQFGEPGDGNLFRHRLDEEVTVTAKDGVLSAGGSSYTPIFLRPKKSDASFSLSGTAYDHVSASPPHTYRGYLEFSAHGDFVRVVLICDLETYVQGVLQSEVPAYFKAEAMKAQAVVARSYGLHPRLSHKQDGFNVCDSYLHCQAFNGVQTLTAPQQEAITATQSQVLIYQGAPALAMFSACAGGHTEDYQNAFSDPGTNAFPPDPISYLKGVPEGKLPSGYPSEEALRSLWSLPHPQTDDAWSMGSFRWQVKFSADQLESYMHHVIEQLQRDPQFEPFIRAPGHGRFGHIKGFSAAKRGVAGTIMALEINTSEGNWVIEKELTIRNAFGNPQLGLKRLKSARILFDQAYDKLGLLASVSVCGFGNGHGVGLQQVGAQGLATAGKKYEEIIAHYYPGTEIVRD